MDFRIRKKMIFVFICIAAYALRYFFALPSADSSSLSYFAGKNIAVEGVILDEVEDFGSTLRSYVEVDTLNISGKRFAVRGRAVLTASAAMPLRYGDRVSVRGVLDSQKNPRPDVAGIFKNPGIHIVRSKEGSDFLSWIYAVKAGFQQRILDNFPHPVSAFAQGILLGTRSAIPQDITLDFKRAGLTHVLAISGFNIIILIQCFEYVFSYLPHKTGIVLTLVGIFLFTLLVGASASVVRASIMGSLSVFAKLFGRRTTGLRTLCIAGFVMVMINPFILLWDIGFQLSFGATAGILIFAKKWQVACERLPNWAGARDAMITTSAAQVFTLPMMIYYFHSFSIISFASNIVVLPFIPWLMLGSFLSMLLGKIIAAPTYLVFKLVLFLIHFFAGIPFGFIDFGSS